MAKAKEVNESQKRVKKLSTDLEPRRFILATVQNTDIFDPQHEDRFKDVCTGDGVFRVKFGVEQEIPERVYENLKNAIPIEYNYGEKYENGKKRPYMEPVPKSRYAITTNGAWYTKSKSGEPLEVAV